MMHEGEKSDLPIVPAKPVNKTASAVAAPVEGSGGTKRNAGPQSTDRTQCRETVSQAQARIREAVSRNPKEKLTALLHRKRWSGPTFRSGSGGGLMPSHERSI